MIKDEIGAFVMENIHWVEEKLKDRNIALIGFADFSEIDPEIVMGINTVFALLLPYRCFPAQQASHLKIISGDMYDRITVVRGR